MLNTSDFIHPEDEAALRQLESIPGFPALVKKILALGYESLQYGINIASCIRLSPTQLPDIYHHLPWICNKMGIAEPEFYLTMDPAPNAWTFGDTRIYITITSGLLDLLNNDELDSVIAHECGHILCRHVLYSNLARLIVDGAERFGLLGSLTLPIQLALLYWMRKSELSCDRVSAIITSPEIVTSSMARIAGGPLKYTKDISLSDWGNQAEDYDRLRTGNTWNNALQLYAIARQDHPFTAVRVHEIMKWTQSEQYYNLKKGLALNASSHKCPHCGCSVISSWSFCKNCGTKL